MVSYQAAEIVAPANEPEVTAPSNEADATTQIVVDENNSDDADSTLGEEVLTSTASMASSIMKYRHENGRTYSSYKDGQYQLPNDEIENERLDLQHHLFALTFDGVLGLSPPNSKNAKVNRVLDIGTGTGIWAIDYADEHPEAHVIGVDISPIQPSFVPPNVTFEIDDHEQPWTFSQKFDYIHSRMMIGSFTHWEKFFQQAFENLSPGGWLEMQDTCYPLLSDDGSLAHDSTLMKWSRNMLEAAKIFNKPLDITLRYEALMKEAGFVNMQVKLYKWPQNSWPKDKRFKEIGVWCEENILSGLQGFSLAFHTRALGWTVDEVEALLVDVRKDVCDKNIHAYWPIWVIYGQKPEATVAAAATES